MKKSSMENQHWLVKKMDLEKKIQAASMELGMLPNGSAQQMEAGDARGRMNSFESGHRRMSDGQKKEYALLRQDFEQKERRAKDAVDRYSQKKSELDQLRREYEALKPSMQDNESCSSSGVELLVKRSVDPWVARIADAMSILKKLRLKRGDLENMRGNNGQGKTSLDEEQLLSADIEEHHASRSAQNEMLEKESSIEDLIRQTDMAINEKEKSLQALRADFAAALRHSVTSFAAIAAKEIAQQFEQIRKTDAFYRESLSRVCNEMVQQTGALPEDVFGHYVQDLRLSPLNGRGKLLSEIEKFVSSAT